MDQSRFEWCLVAFGIGIAAYFAWPSEPKLFVSVLTICTILIAALSLRARIQIYDALILVLFICAGFGRAVHHTDSLKSPLLQMERSFYELTGWIERADQSKSMQNWYIRVETMQGRRLKTPPKRIRLRTKPHGFLPGDAIIIQAMITPPPGPAIVGGYDPARRAYFRGIGGYGFAISVPERVEMSNLPIYERWQRKLIKFRYALSRRIQERAPPRTAGLQAALLTGDRSAIPDAQEDSLRDAGLAHMLAISGLHMGLLAGGAYFLSSLLFSMFGPIARRYDIRKGAAIVGILFASGYLLISGASVSTLRAYIMAVLVFCAVILDRRAVSMRAVALAAGIALMMHPESLLSAGFHMSFAATAALVAVYGYWSRRRTFERGQSFAGRLWVGFKGIFITSAVAGIATGGFAALHFHRFVRYGLLTNLVAMPVFTFVVMPAGFIAVLLIPLGLDRLPLMIMGYGLDFILIASDWVGGLKGAVLYIKGANGIIVSLFGLGFTVLCLGPMKIRVAGSIGVIAALIFWSNIDQPDMRISKDARIAFWDEANVDVLWVDKVRTDRFGRARFVEQSGLKEADLQSYMDTSALCDMQACRLSIKNVRISIVHAPEGVAEACLDSDLVVLTLRRVGPVVRRECNALLIDTGDLEKGGAQDISFAKGAIKIRSANSTYRQTRPWGRQ